MELIGQLLYGVLVAAVVYGGIRSDLRHLHERVAMLHDGNDHAHKRITEHLEHFHTRRNA